MYRLMLSTLFYFVIIGLFMTISYFVGLGLKATTSWIGTPIPAEELRTLNDLLIQKNIIIVIGETEAH